MGGSLENRLAPLWIRFTGLSVDEAVVASSHFHSMAFWSSLFPLLACLTGIKEFALGAFPWGITVIIAEWGPTGRWIDVVTRTAGCLVGVVFGVLAIVL